MGAMSASPAFRVAVSALALSAIGAATIAVHEGYRSRAYADVAGVHTVGFGTTRRDDGSAVQPGDTTTPVRAVVRLAHDAARIERHIKDCLPADLELYPHEWDAFISLAYNIGGTAFCASTLARKLREVPPDYEGACDEILRWTRAAGRELDGLKRRRAAEHELCRTGRTP